jgi:hypothetical protein
VRSLVRVQDGPLKEVNRSILSEYQSVCGKMAKSGGIAQLVERLLCKQDVSGSSPLTSTSARDIKSKSIEARQ